MDLKEASLTMCHLLLHEKRVRDEYEQRLEASAGDSTSTYPTIDMLYEDRLREARVGIAEFGNRLASMPALFDVMESWLVTVIGRQGISEETADEAIKTNNRDDMIERTGALAAAVRDYLRSQGFIIRDMGAGEDGWDMCVRCTEKMSRTLCTDLHQQYMSAISMKLMNVSRRFGGHYLPGLYTWRDARKLLKAFGEAQNDQEDQNDQGY
jgi:hypothetical protein